ncbi:MAG: OmpA family protein [Flavobacteriaceae bacterium]|jgi:chemotaxis protein MotB|nr:OmpA family protein [Flavobacteriaceae bacterium]
MKKLLLLLILPLCTSCVSSKIFNEIESRYATLKGENAVLETEHDQLIKNYDSLRYHYGELVGQYEKQSQILATTSGTLATLQDAYTALEQNSNEALQASIEKNRGLLEEIQIKEGELLSERTRLDSLRNELSSRISRVEELEGLIADKEALMSTLKNALADALVSFKGNGLSVEQRGGKVYVSMENKLLFQSGSWSVASNGKQALKQLGNVLATNPEIAVLIEGHTDSDPYIGNDNLSGNWDLSTKRATEIVKLLLKNNSIKAENLTAAGRGQHQPLATNKTAVGKAKNRRIEVILTPKLDKIAALLEGVED